MSKTLKRISAGVYRDRYGLRAVVNVASGRVEKRFSTDTPLGEIKHWREKEKVRLDAIARRRPSRAGTLRVDVPRYLAQIKGQVSLESWKSRRSEMDAWLALYGHRSRGSLMEADVRAAVAGWRSVEGGRVIGRGTAQHRRPYSVRTCEHRVAALRHLFHVLDGATTPTACDALTFELPATRPVLVSPTVIRDVMATLTHADTKARFAVLAATGVRPSELMRAQPEDVHVKERYWIVRTGKGGTRPAMWLNTDMLAAWRYFIRVKAWGAFDTSTHAKRLYRAGWPKGVRPYNTRATFGMELSRRGADLADIQQLLGHRNLQTTRQYYVPAEDSRLAAASRSLTHRLRLGPLLTRRVGKRKKAKESRREKAS